MRSGKRRCSASGMCALIVLAARKKRLLRDEHGHAAEWLPISVCKKKCMLLCTLASLNECVSVSTRRETSHIDRPLRLAAPASRTPAPCSAAARRARCAFYRRARKEESTKVCVTLVQPRRPVGFLAAGLLVVRGALRLDRWGCDCCGLAFPVGLQSSKRCEVVVKV